MKCWHPVISMSIFIKSKWYWVYICFFQIWRSPHKIFMNNWTWPPREHKGWRKNCYTVVKSSQIDLNMGYNMHEQTIYDVTPVVVNGDMSSWTSDDKLSAYLFSRQKWRFWNDKFYVYGWKTVKELSNIDETWQLCQWMTTGVISFIWLSWWCPSH